MTNMTAFFRAIAAALLLVLAPACAPTTPPAKTQPATTRAPEATTQKTLWWQNVLDREVLLQAHAVADAKTPARWVEPPGVDTYCSLMVGEQKRGYLLHLPASYDGKTPLPLVIALHGGGMDGTSMAYYSGLSDVADRESFIVAYPDGAIRPAKNSWNAQVNSPPDDVVFIRELLAHLQDSLAVDRHHVMLTGGSAGALMTYRYALESGEHITAICSMCGTFAWNMRNGEPPAMPAPGTRLSLLAIHGRLDKSVPYDGFESDKARVWPTARSVAFWTKFDECAPVALEERQPGVLKQTWTGGRDGTEVCLISLDDFGHNLPTRLTDAGPIKCSQVLWDFLVRDRGCRLLPRNRMFVGPSTTVTAERNARLLADAELHFTTDGSAPTAASARYEGPITITAESTTVRVQAFLYGKPAGAETLARYVRLPLAAPQALAKSAPGLCYAYYEGAWPSLPDANDVMCEKPVATGVCAAPDLALVKHRAQDFAVVFTGYVRVPKQGVYTFSSTSDDANDIWLNRSRIVDSDGLHDPIECSRSVALSAGVYPITIHYLQRGGEAVLSVSMEGPGMAKRVVAGEDFCHEE